MAKSAKGKRSPGFSAMTAGTGPSKSLGGGGGAGRWKGAPAVKTKATPMGGYKRGK